MLCAMPLIYACRRIISYICYYVYRALTFVPVNNGADS